MHGFLSRLVPYSPGEDDAYHQGYILVAACFLTGLFSVAYAILDAMVGYWVGTTVMGIVGHPVFRAAARISAYRLRRARRPPLPARRHRDGPAERPLLGRQRDPSLARGRCPSRRCSSAGGVRVRCGPHWRRRLWPCTWSSKRRGFTTLPKRTLESNPVWVGLVRDRAPAPRLPPRPRSCGERAKAIETDPGPARRARGRARATPGGADAGPARPGAKLAGARPGHGRHRPRDQKPAQLRDQLLVAQRASWRTSWRRALAAGDDLAGGGPTSSATSARGTRPASTGTASAGRRHRPVDARDGAEGGRPTPSRRAQYARGRRGSRRAVKSPSGAAPAGRVRGKRGVRRAHRGDGRRGARRGRAGPVRNVVGERGRRRAGLGRRGSTGHLYHVCVETAAADGRGVARPGPRQRARHTGGRPRPGLRALLHHQAGGRGNGPRAGAHARHRECGKAARRASITVGERRGRGHDRSALAPGAAVAGRPRPLSAPADAPAPHRRAGVPSAVA